MGITVLEFCNECDPDMYLDLCNHYTGETKLLQAKDILEHKSDWLGMEVVGRFDTYYAYSFNGITTKQPISILSLNYY